MTMSSFFGAVLFVTGYVASIYSWPKVKIWVNGTEAEIASLELKAAALKGAALKVVR